MVLKTRNRIFFVVFSISLISIVIIGALFVKAAISDQIIPPPTDYSKKDSTVFFLRYSFSAMLLSIAVMALYVPVILFLIYINFEKTQSSEVIFFLAFLIGVMTETARLINPLFGLWKSFTTLLIFGNRLVFFGRIVCPLSFLFSALMSDSEQRQDIERNFTIMIAIAAMFAYFVPLNTTHITPTCVIPWGYENLFSTIFIILSIVAAISMFINAKIHDNKEMIKILIGFIILYTGYNLLISSDTYASLFSGSILLFLGTYVYLKNIHLLYLWQ